MMRRALALLLCFGAAIGSARADFDPEANTLVARPGAPLEGVHDGDWARRLPDLLPAIRACLAALPDSYVIAGLPGAATQPARIRLVAADRHRVECSVEAGQASLRPLAPQDRWPAEARTAFFADRYCVDAKRVEDPQGRVVGWLAYPECR